MKLGNGLFCCSEVFTVATFRQHFSQNDVICVIHVSTRDGLEPLEIQEEPRFLAAQKKWSCGELNPGPVTVPSVFYVRSLLAMRRFFCPHRCRRQLMASISAEKVPQPPCGAVAGASLLNDAQHLPEDEGE
ncbi:hypothetical protein BPORC_0899 [Bifidobacterium porcinum]|nr:hypothetical protein BPORC_0899 [Bifidobacterium porcinum]